MCNNRLLIQYRENPSLCSMQMCLVIPLCFHDDVAIIVLINITSIDPRNRSTRHRDGSVSTMQTYGQMQHYKLETDCFLFSPSFSFYPSHIIYPIPLFLLPHVRLSSTSPSLLRESKTLGGASSSIVAQPL